MAAHGGIEWGKMLNILRKRGKLILSSFPDIEFSSVDLVPALTKKIRPKYKFGFKQGCLEKV